MPVRSSSDFYYLIKGAHGEPKALVGVGLRVLDESNVIIRNIKIQKVLASAGDAIGIQASSQVWVDHVDLSSVSRHPRASVISNILMHDLGPRS